MLGVLFLKPPGAKLITSQYFELLSGVLNLLAAVMFVLAFTALRPSLRVSPIPKPGSPLIVVGIYKWFRHPMYIGVLLIGFGMMLNNLNWASIVIFMFLTINMITKANYEDELLRERHPSAVDYQKKVFGLIGRRSA